MGGLGRLAVPCCACLIQACASVGASLEPPDLSLTGLQIGEIGLFEQRLGLDLRVQNPNSVGLPIRGLSLELELAGKRVAKGVSAESFDVPAYGESTFQMNVSTNLLASVIGLSAALEESESLEYVLSGKVQVDLPLAGAVPFRKSGTVQLRRAVTQ